MRRRITVAILATTAAALLLTGLGTYLLTRSQIRRTTQSELRDEARALLPFVTEDSVLLLTGRQPANAVRSARLARAAEALDLADASVMAVDRDGTVLVGSPPAGITAAALHDEAFRPGTAAAGMHDRLAWGAASSEANAQGRFVVVALSRPVPSGLGGGGGWLLLTGLAVLALAAIVAVRLGDRMAAPLRATETATRRIAGGDLSARVDERAAGHPGDELDDLARSVNAMAGALERSRQTERQFLLSVSHDLRTPLTSIRGYAEAIGDGAVTDPAAASAVILEEARRLERLVGDLLDLARLEARQFSLHPEPVDLAVLAATAVEGFRPAAQAAGVDLAFAAPGVPVPVHVDGDRLVQAVANLCENGLKFARTSLRVAVSVEGGWAVLDVSDDGPGIAPAELPRVFERLYVAQGKPVRSGPGSGLGLAIARELVTAMGGHISAASPPTGGTTMRIALPMT